MPQTIEELLEAFNDAEESMNLAETEKNSALTALEEWKRENATAISSKTLNAIQNATLTSLKDDVALQRRIFNASKSAYEVAKFRAKKGGAIVVQRATFRDTDSPEIKGWKEEISELRKGIADRMTQVKDLRDERRKRVDDIDRQITGLLADNHKTKEAIAELRKKIGEKDPSQAPKATGDKSGSASGKRGRPSRFSGKTIALHSDFVSGENPCRANSSVARTVEAFREATDNEMLYDDAIASNIPSRDIVTLFEGGKLVVRDEPKQDVPVAKQAKDSD